MIDDGSSDDTTEVAQAAGAHIIRHEKNKGAGALGFVYMGVGKPRQSHI